MSRGGLALAALISLALLGCRPKASPPRKVMVKDVLEAEWAATVKDKSLMRSELTADFPASWPPNGDGLVSYFAYSSGMPPGLSDGQLVGSVWGRIVLDPETGGTWFTRLSPRTQELGTQGVRPMSKEEIDLYKRAPEAIQMVRDLAKLKDAPRSPDPLLRAVYCQSYRFSGVITTSLPRPEADFQRWLDCRN